jgi:hypothetical protein
MTDQPRFLLGRGENLTRPGKYRSRDPGDAAEAYTFYEQQAVLGRQLHVQEEAFAKLPKAACPGDVVVSMMTLHPSAYARSRFPEHLLKMAGLSLLGSMPRQVKPRAGRGHDKEGGAASTLLFVSGTRKAFKHLTQMVTTGEDLDEKSANELLRIEAIQPQTADDRLKGELKSKASPLEVVLHLAADADGVEVEDQFLSFAEKSGLKIRVDQVYQSRGLWFAPATGSAAQARSAAEFSVVRAIRPMPELRPVEELKILRSVKPEASVVLPAEGPIDTGFRVAVFDGGLPEDHPFGLWASRIEPLPTDQIGNPVSDYVDHGQAVTSALLFGHMDVGVQPRPYSHVDHYRVLGTKTTEASLYNVLLCIDRVLQQEEYRFISLSIGPVEIVGDDQVSAWTTMLDDHLLQLRSLATIAIGNDGHLPAPHNRVQVPGDSVNALAVGASDGTHDGWQRAPYSCVGPGRCPGLTKPDIVHFGGVDGNMFRFLLGNGLGETQGTSFASPTVMRLAAGIRAHFGEAISPLAIRALIIHSAERGDRNEIEVGWGQAASDIDSITVCPDGSVRILYQGTLDPGKVTRAVVPLPDLPLKGMITIRGTFCYASQTDPHTPGDYTRAGLGVTFRPHSDKLGSPKGKKPGWIPNPEFPESRSFFQEEGKIPEQSLRKDARKWDTVRHAQDTMRASSLKNPIFDIHYQAREPGSAGSPSQALRLPYALVLTISASQHADIYDDVITAFPVLAPIMPKTLLPTVVRNPATKRP